ncbi:M56 family metallopeptidase [Bdellovibrio bacteriovorus]|uniref:M56 family metallopeptidase n=1 Tax=Bdellovibrio TaxID=958 RepID=UPI0035A8B262
MQSFTSALDFTWKFLVLVSLSSTFIFGAFVFAQGLLKKVSGKYFKLWSQASLVAFLSTMTLFAGLLLTLDKDLQAQCFKHFADAQGTMGLTRILAGTWLLTVIGLFAKEILQYRAFQQKVLDNVLREAEGYHVVTDKFSPLTFGFLKYTIVIPEYLTQNTDHLQYILAHERTHIANRDGFWNLLSLLCLRVCWFNPLVWVFAKARVLAVEMATDEQTISQNNFSSKEYAASLVFAISANKSLSSPAALGASLEFAQMKMRLENLDPRKTKRTRIKTVIAVLMASAWFVGVDQSLASIQMERFKPSDELMCYQVQHEKVIESWFKKKTATNKCE